MKAMGRSTLAVLVGVIVAMGLTAVIEMVGNHLYPLPPGLDIHDHASMREYVHAMPTGAFVMVLLAWAVGAGTGAWVAARLAGRARLVHGLIVGALFLAAGIMNMLMVPHPIWMWIGGVAVLAGCGYLGARAAAATPAQVAS
jgi:hypothetical protein